jgi:hypothetical protein
VKDAPLQAFRSIGEPDSRSHDPSPKSVRVLVKL